MSDEQHSPDVSRRQRKRPQYVLKSTEGPILNYSLSTVCPACNYPTIRRACKVRCERCGFMWDCSEL
jgi:hypothetical protein